MGYNARPNNVLLFLGALEQCLQAQKLKVASGGVDAANAVYANNP
jgi:aspartate aminotransferase-like enzyme